ncbi:tetratricopeptide repeat protein [Hyphomicrobium sp.]|uniref:tetratricopeptide repeat protein n=1 Tax=Hyphomicrobium sp. TaxID=82 RepID=UPI002E31BED5|nr:tetratricopeptide repeat protein [Hyphomicrobium sp.]HEX2841436.1 tetratricopeptide repeat protein [Hyphomicrobium sp.]
MVDKNDALFREVEEELRREKFQKLWERYGTYFIILAVALIALVAGAKLWESQRIANANAAGAEFEAATALMNSGKTEEAAKAFQALSASGPKGYAALASLSEAGAYLKMDKAAEALSVFDKLASDSSTEPMLANYARLQGASLRLGEADFTEMQNRLKPLTGDDSPWRFTARELLGTAAVKAGKLDEARTTLAPLLADPGLSRGASERINRLMGEIATSELSGTPSSVSGQVSAPVGDAEKPASAP